MDMKRILQAMDGAATKPVAGANDMSKFLSIIDNNNVSVLKEEQNNTKLNEGANPHKVSLPVQMAMQHFQTPVSKPVAKKPSLLKQYFAEAEEAQAQEVAEKQERLKMYSQKIANRVLVKESTLKDKEDLKAKRKALQDIQMDPATSKDPQLKKELIQRKAALEKEAKRRGLDEARLAPDQLAKLMQFKQSNAKPVEPQSASIQQLSPDQQADVDQWGKDLKASWDSRSTANRRPQPAARVQQTEPTAQAEPEERNIDVESLTLPELQELMVKVNQLIRVMEKVEQRTLRAEKFPGGITPGLQADLELNMPTPTSLDEYNAALELWTNKLEKLEQFISMKRATWAKKKTPVYENEEQQPVRDERTIQQEIKAAQKELTKVEYTRTKVREVTKEIKYEDTPGSIVLRIRALADAVPNIDGQDLQYAEKDVFNAVNALESAVYGLEEAFNDAVRSAQNKLDELESELDEINWNKKYGRPGV